jgi:tetratricopeptide (TPR) repeat protein
VQLTDGEVARLRSSTTKSVDAYLHYQKGVDVYFSFTKEAMPETRRLMEEALSLDPNFTSAMILKAWTYLGDADFGDSNSRETSIVRAENELAGIENLGQELAILVTGEALMIRAYIELLRGNYERSVEYGEKSIDQLPNHAAILATLGSLLHFAGKNEYAVEFLRKAMRVDPRYQSWYASIFSKVLISVEDYVAAEIAARDAIERASIEDDTNLALAHLSMAIVYTEQGKIDLGKMDVRSAMELAPWLNLRQYKSSTHYQKKGDLERFRAIYWCVTHCGAAGIGTNSSSTTGAEIYRLVRVQQLFCGLKMNSVDLNKNY